MFNNWIDKKYISLYKISCYPEPKVIVKTKIDVDELETVPVDLIKLSGIVKNVVVKKIVYDKLVKKVNTIDTKVPNNELATKEYMIQTHKILKKRLKMLIKRYLTLVNL